MRLYRRMKVHSPEEWRMRREKAKRKVAKRTIAHPWAMKSMLFNALMRRCRRVPREQAASSASLPPRPRGSSAGALRAARERLGARAPARSAGVPPPVSLATASAASASVSAHLHRQKREHPERSAQPVVCAAAPPRNAWSCRVRC